jgi:PKD repeat protein
MVLDGPNAGLSVTTNANGSYRFNALAIANMNFSATASGYLEKRAGTFVSGTNGLDFVLESIPPPPPAPAPPPSPTITIGTRIISGGGGSSTQEWGFSAVSNVTDYTSYDWTFGDGGISFNAGSEEQHVYRAKGTYTVTVVGHRRQGDVTGTGQITVQ